MLYRFCLVPGVTVPALSGCTPPQAFIPVPRGSRPDGRVHSTIQPKGALAATRRGAAP